MSGFLVLATVMMIMGVAVPTHAATPDSPLHQHHAGIPIDGIQCDGGKLLMVTLAGNPVCLTGDSTMKLADRGSSSSYATIYTPETSQKANEPLNEKITSQTDTHVFTDKEKQIIADYKESSMLSSPGILIHSYSLDLSESPKMGQTAVVNFTGIYTDNTNFEPYMESFTLKVFANPDNKVQFYNATTNAGSDDPTSFDSFDNDIGYVVDNPVPGRAYTVMVTVKILEEGFIEIDALRFHSSESSGGVYLAISNEHSMPENKYMDEEHTFLDHDILARESSPESFAPQKDSRLGNKPGPKDEIVNEDLTEERVAQIYANHLRLLGEIVLSDIGKVNDDLIGWLVDKSLPLDDVKIILGHSNFTQAQKADAMERYETEYTGPQDMSDGAVTATTTTAAYGSPTDASAAPAFPVAATQETSDGSAAAAEEDSSSNTFSIEGTVSAPLYHSRTTQPVNGIEVCAYDYSESDGTETAVLLTTEGDEACTFTSNMGEYHIDSIQNDDPSDASNVDLVIKIISRGANGLVLQDMSENVYEIRSTGVLNFSQDTRMYDFELNGNNAEAAGIINAISDGRDFFSHHGIPNARLTVHWEPGWQQDTMYLHSNRIRLDDHSNHHLDLLII